MLIPMQLESQESFGIAARVICPTLPGCNLVRESSYLPWLWFITLLLSEEVKYILVFGVPRRGGLAFPCFLQKLSDGSLSIHLKVWGKELRARRLAGRYSLFLVLIVYFVR